MPVYVGDLPIDDILSDDGDYDAVYLGSDQVWPPIEFPYVIENSNLTDSEVPSGAVGVIPELIGAGGLGHAGVVMPVQNNVVAAGGDGGGGGAAIGSVGLRFFIPIEDLGSLFSSIVGTAASRFISGGVDLIAGAGTTTAGGTPTVSGIGYAFSSPGAGPGADNGFGGAGGGGQGRTASRDSQNISYSAGAAGGRSMTKAGGPYGSPDPVPDAGHPSGGAGGRADFTNTLAARGYGAGGPGGSGKVGTGTAGTEGGPGGPGYLRLTFTDKRHAFARFTAAGAWSWTLPSWLHNGDKVVISAHGGGRGGDQGSSTSAGRGGQAGAWNDVVLTVGTDIAAGGTLVGSIGAGGAANSGNGGNTTCTTVGLTALGATANNGVVASNGNSLANHAYLDEFNLGGLGGAYVALSQGLAGGPGSGGGAGGSVFFVGQSGGAGGGGRLFIHAYQV